MAFSGDQLRQSATPGRITEIILLIYGARLPLQALIKQKCNLLNLLTTHFDCLLRDSAAPPGRCGDS